MDAVFNNSVPIYLQIVSEIKKQIVSGKLIPGERIPSVRELALTYKVNPNTMQKALIELEENGLIKTITALRYSSKIYLLFRIFHNHLLECGVKEENIK